MKKYTTKDLIKTFNNTLGELCKIAGCSVGTMSNIFKENNKISEKTKESVAYYLKQESERMYKEEVARICNEHRERIKLINYILKER